MSFTERLRLPGSISRGQTALILALLPLGLVAVVTVPLGGGFDEIEHFRRTWEMAAGHLVPNSALGEQVPAPRVMRQLSYREQPIVRAVEDDDWRRYGTLPLDAAGWETERVATRSIYSPAVLAPQAVLVHLFGRRVELPALPLLYAARLAGLLSYVALAYLAVRWIPFGKWTMALLVAAPLALFQASTLTADTLSNGFAVLFIAGSLALVRRETLGRREWAALAGLIALLFLAKSNLAPLAIVPLLIARPSQFQSRRAYLALWAAAGLLFAVEVVGWNLVAYPGSAIMITDAGPVDHLLFVLGHPAQFFAGLLGDLGRNGFDYLRGWIAAYGYYYWPVPAPAYWLWGVGLAAALVRDSRGEYPSERARLVLLGAWLAGYLATAMLLQFIGVTPGSGTVRELQGRYFTAVMPLFFLALIGVRGLSRLPAPPWLIAGGGIASLVIFAGGMMLSYRVPCGSSFYRFGPCHLPQYKNYSPDLDLPPSSPPVDVDTRLDQEFVAECDGLTEVRVWPLGERARVPGSVRFQLVEVDVGHEIPLTSLGPSGLPDEGWLGLTFNTRWDSKGRRYRLTIQAEERAVDPPRFIYTQRPEYAGGVLAVDGQATEQDLFFQYGCLAGLEQARYMIRERLLR